jgi:hypothetical protein
MISEKRIDIIDYLYEYLYVLVEADHIGPQWAPLWKERKERKESGWRLQHEVDLLFDKDAKFANPWDRGRKEQLRDIPTRSSGGKHHPYPCHTKFPLPNSGASGR